MYPAFATTEFGLGLEERAPDYLIKGSRVQLWVSLTSTPWWSGPLVASTVSILLGPALAQYRLNEAKKWMAKAKDVLSNDVFTNVSASVTGGGGAVSIMATTTVDFSREGHAPGRMLEVLRNAGLKPVEQKWQIIQRGPDGKKNAPLKNTINPDDTNNCDWLCQLGLKQQTTIPDKDPDCGFLCALGLSTPFVVAGAILLGVILLRNR